MEKAQPPGVEGLTLQRAPSRRRVAANLAPRDPAPAAVLPIAEHRAADVAEVDADLVRPAGLGQDPQAAKPSNRSATS